MRNFILFTFIFFSLNTIFSQEEKENRLIENPATLILLEEAKHFYTECKLMEALINLRSIESKDETSAKVKYWISLCYYKLNIYTMALAYAKNALTLDKTPSVEF